MNNFIEIKNLYKSFGEKSVLKDFSACIKENGITMLMGPSGCGKTTLLRLIAGLEKPDSGTIARNNPGKTAMVFQEDRLCENLTAQKNIALVCTKEVSKQTIFSHLKTLGLDDISLAKNVGTFSGGMKRRVALVRAMLSGAPLILLDEPLKGLDEETRKVCAAYILDQCRDKTVIMVSHDADDAKLFHAQTIYLPMQ